MKRVLVMALALSVNLLLPGRSVAEQKIAYVDLQRALEETNEGKKARAALKAEFEKKQKELEQRQEELKRLKADIDRQRSTLKPEVIAAKDQELQQKVAQLQETWGRLQQDMRRKEAESMQRILQKMKAMIALIAQARDMTYVFDRSSGLLYAPLSLDLTDELIQKFNASGAK
jgi:outer membrane protein